mgnify:CR=1 FL=1
MDIDVQGADQVRDSESSVISDTLVDIFLTTADTAELEKRLLGRGSEDEDTFQLRMRTAVAEIKRWRDYTYCIVSGEHDEDFSIDFTGDALISDYNTKNNNPEKQKINTQNEKTNKKKKPHKKT